jgi:superfamily I DNA and RNA helicase
VCETGFNQVFVWGFGSRFDDRIAFPAFERSFALLKRDLDLFFFFSFVSIQVEWVHCLDLRFVAGVVG